MTTVATFAARKARGEPIVMATAYDLPTARMVDAAGLDAILVGDSLGMVVLGHADTLAVTVADMIHHTKAVRRAATAAMVITDMPFMSYQASVADAVRNAGRLVQRGGAQAVKLEGGARSAPAIRSIVEAGIPVQGHVGLTPQSLRAFGGWKVQGRTAAAAKQLVDDARALQDAGCFSIVIECVPRCVAAHLTQSLEIPTIGIGAGPDTSGQVLVLHDLLGLQGAPRPRFVKAYADVAGVAHDALTRFRQEVRDRTFPAAEHTYDIPESEWQEFLASS